MFYDFTLFIANKIVCCVFVEITTSNRLAATVGLMLTSGGKYGINLAIL
ncbi:hypothetical protein yfred0001_2000 [Yersinia frederiksenii ATCC 33641]|nr:hypothetical protein yfred0001_2000 [Yersinia frederiksenii ATCC 33641]